MKKIKKNTWRYHYFIPAYQQSSWNYLQFLRYRVSQTEIGNYGSFFALYSPPPKNPKNQNFEKIKKIARAIIILHKCSYQKPQSYEAVQFLRYGVRQTEFFLILGHFLTLYPLTTRKIKILKQWKKHLEMSSLYTCVPKITIICPRPVKSPAFGGWHLHFALISSTPASIDVSSSIPMIFLHWSRFWFVFTVKITHPLFPAKSCVVWLPCNLFVHLCTCLMMAWIAPYLSMRSLVWRHCQVAIHWGKLYIAWFLLFCCLIYHLYKCLLIFATSWINLRSEK